MLNVLIDERPPVDARPFAGADQRGDPASDFVCAEITRLGATADEIEAALAFADVRRLDFHAYQGMSPRMRRLVDLVGVTGRATTVCACAIPIGTDPAKG